MKKYFTFFATCPKGMDELLSHELTGLGIKVSKGTPAGVHFKGDLETGYRVCLWSRLTNRVLLPLARFQADTPDDLYEKTCAAIDWHEHLKTDGSLAVDFSADHSHAFHSRYALLRVKDAIVDQFRDRFGSRPSVDRERPHIRVHLHIKGSRATISLDLSGQSLHKRGYRTGGGIAPLKENLAAAILIRAGWPELARTGAGFIDPLCGSGTLLIEAAFMALDRAPALLRDYFGFEGWRGHDAAVWEKLLAEAHTRAGEGWKGQEALFYGFDRDPAILAQARTHAARAGLSPFIRFQKQSLQDLERPKGLSHGLVVANPPYGERMGDRLALRELYETLGQQLKRHFQGWQAAIFTANPDLARHMDLRPGKTYTFYNGALPCRLFRFEVTPPALPEQPLPVLSPGPKNRPGSGSSGADMFANRLRKNLKTVGKWAQKEGISCYRLYDADMPEYAVAVDRYEDRILVQEYPPPKGMPLRDAGRRFEQIRAALPEVLEVSPGNITLWRAGPVQSPLKQRVAPLKDQFVEVGERGLRILIHLGGSLDTGFDLFQREVRRLLREQANGKSILVPFCGTGGITLFGAAGGARETTSLDPSRSRLARAKQNLALNRLATEAHRFLPVDALTELPSLNALYDLIFVHPPAYTRYGPANGPFEVQRDHVALLERFLPLLTRDGRLYFYTQARGFKLNRSAFQKWRVRDHSRATLPRDFERTPRQHHLFEIQP